MGKKVFCILASPGVGKTTLVNKLSFNINTKTSKIITIEEDVRALVLAHENFKQLDHLKRNENIIENNPSVDTFIKDGSFFSGLYYINEHEENNKEELEEYIKQISEKYENTIFYIPFMKNENDYDYWNRKTDYSESIKVDKFYKDYMIKKGIKFFSVNPIITGLKTNSNDFDCNNINDIVKHISPLLGSYFYEDSSIEKIIKKTYLNINPETISYPLENGCDFLDYNIYNKKIIIIGQDPYPSLGKAMGIPFSSLKETTSAKNICSKICNKEKIKEKFTKINFKNLKDDRVMFVNSSLTTLIDKPWSHFHLWENYMNAIISMINFTNIEYVFFWGSKHAVFMLSNLKEKLRKPYFILPHPSPKGTDDYNLWEKICPFTIMEEISGLKINWSDSLI